METPASAAHPRITLGPSICHGQPTVRGLRYPVLEYLASGMTEAEILAAHEDLEAMNLRACQASAALLRKKSNQAQVPPGTILIVSKGNYKALLTTSGADARRSARTAYCRYLPAMKKC